LLAADAVDPTTGYSNVVKNVGTINNQGVEISVGGDIIRQKDFKWNANFIFAYNKNEVKKYNATRNYTANYYGIVNVEGYPAKSLWGARFAGLNDEGHAQAYNQNGDIIPISALSTKDLVYQGTVRPKNNLSLTNSFAYHNWDFSFMFIAQLGHKYRKDAFTGSNYQSRHVADRWKEAGDEAHTIYPVLSAWSEDMFEYPFIDALVGNASFAKLRDVTLSYTLDKALTKKVGISNAKVYLQARNLLTITAKGTDIDPESFQINNDASGIVQGDASQAAWSSLPLPREFYIGLQFEF
jgi:hypothetical protein